MKIIRVILMEPVFWQLNDTRDAVNTILEKNNEKRIGGSRLVSLAISEQMYRRWDDNTSDIWDWVKYYREIPDSQRVLCRFNLIDSPDLKDYLQCLAQSTNKSRNRDVKPITRDELVGYILEKYLPRILKKIEATHSPSQA